MSKYLESQEIELAKGMVGNKHGDGKSMSVFPNTAATNRFLECAQEEGVSFNIFAICLLNRWVNENRGLAVDPTRSKIQEEINDEFHKTLDELRAKQDKLEDDLKLLSSKFDVVISLLGGMNSNRSAGQ